LSVNRVSCFFSFFLFYYLEATKMATDTSDQRPAGGVKAEKLTKTNKFDAYMKSGDLYSLPVTAVPGCGFMLGYLLKRNGITRASELYDLYTKQKKGFAKYLACKFGSWNTIYANTVIKAFEDWEKIHVVKPEKKVKITEEKKKGPPRKVGPGSKKWEDFLKRTDLSVTSIMSVPGVASTLGCEMKKRGYNTAKQLMDQFKGDKKGQCNGDDDKFNKWILCCFGYWNTQYSKVVLAAIKAYDSKTVPPPIVQEEVKQEPTENNENQGDVPVEPSIKQEPTEDNENQGDVPVEPSIKQEPTEDNENQGDEDQEETLKDKLIRLAEEAADSVAEALEQSEEETSNWNRELEEFEGGDPYFLPDIY